MLFDFLSAKKNAHKKTTVNKERTMDFQCLFAASTSLCFELCNDLAYYSDRPFDVTVNGKTALTGVNTNVFSLFDLEPDTEYTVSVDGSEGRVFRTSSESACISVADFGAKGDGVTDDTNAIQTAIHACPRNGRVLVPAGTYLCRPIVLRSHMTLELSEGATLLASTNEADYPLWPGEVDDAVTGEKVQCNTWEGHPQTTCQAFISAYHSENIKIIGRGVIDGNAQNAHWWINVKERKVARPRLFFLNCCEDVQLHGITGQNSAAWNFQPFFSSNIGFYDTAVKAPKDSPNTDGLDPESCDNVNIIGMRFSVGDDAIAIKAGKMYMGMKYQTPASNHTIRNCLMEYAHGAVVLGSEMSGGVKDLTVNRCLFVKTDRGLRIKTRRGRGKYAVIDGVTFENIKMEGVLTPLVINMYYFCDPDGKTEPVQSKQPMPVDDGTPYLGSFTFRNMTCESCEAAAGFFYGLPEQPIGSVTIENVSFTYSDEAQPFMPAMMCGIEPHLRAGLVFNNVKNVSLSGVTVDGCEGERVTMNGVETFKEV